MDVQGLSPISPESVRETFEVLQQSIFYVEVLLFQLAGLVEAARWVARKRS